MARTLELVPSDATLVLDVGCGDGRITRRLAGSRTVVSVDVHLAALRTAGGTCACACASRLPFPDKSFDLVCATEILEHLTNDIYQATVSELIRVSSRYVLVSVPFQERLEEDNGRCCNCGRLYHVWGHVRSFSAGGLKNLTPGLELLNVRLCGKNRRTKVTTWVRQHLGRQWSANKYSACPHCGNRSHRRPKRNVVTYVCGVIERLLLVLHRPRWAICLYGPGRKLW